jgi:copper(I)-binding protein
MRRVSAFVLALSAAFAVSAPAQEYKSGDITIERPWARATPKGAEVGAGYLTIRNNGASPEQLTGGSADFGAVEIHEMKTENGVMTMTELKKGLNIPAHGAIKFAPGGYHIMFTHLTKPFTKGDTIKATLAFEHSPPVEVEFSVEGMGASGPSGAKAGMGGMKM